ncbi:MAG: hypothetical protein K8S62_15860 [Candidatus Sabulitectum sp.]|nr:hypothetical protein [Candidatus Sabulitectum sp.]
MFRLHFLHHRKLLPKLCRCAWDSLSLFLQEALDRRDVFAGGILVPQTFGGMANWNPHVHALITDTSRAIVELLSYRQSADKLMI